jgi:hypothetical protein
MTDTPEPPIMMVNKYIRAEAIKSGAYVNLADFNGKCEFRALNIWVSKEDLVCPRFDEFRSWQFVDPRRDCRAILALAKVRRIGLDDFSARNPSEYWCTQYPRYLPPCLSRRGTIRQMIPFFHTFVCGPEEIVFYSLPSGHKLSASTNLIEVEEDQLDITRGHRRRHDLTVTQVATMLDALMVMTKKWHLNTLEGRQVRAKMRQYFGFVFVTPATFNYPRFKFMMVKKG